MVEYFKSKKNVLIIVSIAVAIILVIILIVFLFSGSNGGGNKLVEVEEREIKNTVEKIEDGKITVSDFKVTYNQVDKRWYLSMSVKNTSDKEIDLKDYSLKLYHDEEMLVEINGTALGKIPAQTQTGSVIALGDNYSEVNFVEIVKE